MSQRLNVVAAGLIDVCFGDADEGYLVTGMGAKPKDRFCTHRRLDMAWSGRKRPVCLEVRIVCKRTFNAAHLVGSE